jgi:hypothetical protein
MFFGLLIILALKLASCKLQTKYRPAQVTKWINNGRKYDSQPNISRELKSFMISWWKWWTVLQPPSRRNGAELSREVVNGELWAEIRKGSQNGLFTVILCLAWWQRAASTSAQIKEFKVAVEDVIWVMDQILREGKRPREGNNDGPRSSKRLKAK